MTLPYENASSGSGALDDIRKVLTRFGCSRFGTMTDNDAGELCIARNAELMADLKCLAAQYGDKP